MTFACGINALFIFTFFQFFLVFRLLFINIFICNTIYAFIRKRLLLDILVGIHILSRTYTSSSSAFQTFQFNRIILILNVWRQIMKYTLRMANIQNIWVCVQIYSLPRESWKNEIFCGVRLDFFSYFNFEFLKFFFNFVINMSLVKKKIIWIIFFLFKGIVNILSLMSNVINCGLNHILFRNVLSERLISQNFALGSYLRFV